MVGEGGLDTGATGAGDQYNGSAGAAQLTDAKLAEMVKQIFASNQAARDKVFAILAEIQNKQKQIGPELGDPASVTLFQQFIDQKFGEIQNILNDTQVDAKTQAAILDALADEYRNSGPQRDEVAARAPAVATSGRLLVATRRLLAATRRLLVATRRPPRAPTP